jgi:hypothetical protein
MNNNLNELLKKGKITNKTIERLIIAKSYIEKKYNILKQKESKKKKSTIKFLFYIYRLGINIKKIK